MSNISFKVIKLTSLKVDECNSVVVNNVLFEEAFKGFIPRRNILVVKIKTK